ncbi:unnamed protein product, partial [Ectocarpus fasciculatus]
MSLSTTGHALLVFVAALDTGFCQRSLHGVPFAGIGSVRPLRSASSSPVSSPMSTVLNGSTPEIEGETATNSSSSLNSTADAVDAVATNSSRESETDVGVWANSSSSSSSSAVYALELIPANTSAAVGDTVLSN